MSGRPIRVCYMIDRLMRGGTELRLVRLINALDRKVVNPHLVLLDGTDELSKSLAPVDVPVLRLGIQRLRSPSNMRKLLRLCIFLRQHKIDIMEVYFSDSTTFGVPAARLAGVPHIVTTCFNLQHSATWMDHLRDRVYRPLVSATITNCLAGREVIARRTTRTYGGKVHVLENGIELDHYLRRSLPVHRGQRCRWRIGMLANLRPVKDPETFVRAAAELVGRRDDIEFVMAGDGPLRATLEELCSNLKINHRFKFLGTINDTASFLESLDIAVLCSRAEGLSNAIIEYMAAARPIIVTDVGGNIELIKHGVTGLLVPPGDVFALSAAIDQLLFDRPFALRMAETAHRDAQRRFSTEKMKQRFEDFYCNLFLDARKVLVRSSSIDVAATATCQSLDARGRNAAASGGSAASNGRAIASSSVPVIIAHVDK